MDDEEERFALIYVVDLDNRRILQENNFLGKYIFSENYIAELTINCQYWSIFPDKSLNAGNTGM